MCSKPACVGLLRLMCWRKSCGAERSAGGAQLQGQRHPTATCERWGAFTKVQPWCAHLTGHQSSVLPSEAGCAAYDAYCSSAESASKGVPMSLFTEL